MTRPTTFSLVTAVIFLSACGDNLTHPPTRDPYSATQPQPLQCVPNLDGQIDADELPVGFDVPVNYRINPSDETRTVDLAGLVDQNGGRAWDFSTDNPDDQKLTITAQKPASKWYADSFPDAEFVTPLDAAGTIDGVYRRTSDSVQLLGYASKTQSPKEGKTLVVYTDPVTVYRFPLKVGDQWVSTGEVRDGTVRDLPYAGRDVYTISVDADGALWLPDFQFKQAYRVRTDLAIEPAVGEGTTRKQVSFVFECFGEVARVTSKDNETKKNFDTAVEVRRLGL